MSERNRMPLLIGGVVVAVLAALGLALLVTNGDDESSDGSVVQTTPDTAETPDGTDPSSTEPASTEPTPPEPVALEATDASVVVTGDPLSPYDPGELPDAAFGLPGPLVQGQDYEGNPSSIGGPSDGPTMLVFLAHWCPHCNDEIPVLIELNDNGDLPDDLNVIGISTAVDKSGPNYPPSEWLADAGWPWPVLADSVEAEAFLAYGGTGFPFTTMLDEDGNVLARKAGASSGEEALAWIQDALS